MYAYGTQFSYIALIILVQIGVIFVSRLEKTEEVTYILYILHVIQLFIIKLVIQNIVKQLKEKPAIDKFAKEFVKNDIDLIDIHDKVVALTDSMEEDDKIKMMQLFLEKFKDDSNQITEVMKYLPM